MGLLSTIAGDALLGLGDSILGNLFGFGNQQSVNETNMQIAQMNNEFNERMLERQLQYNTEMFGNQTAYDQKKMQQQNAFTREMWNANNQYNSASAQRQRFEAAGLNPYMMMNGGSAGIAGASSSSGSGGSPSAQGINPPTATPVQVQAYKPDLSGFTNIISQLMDIEAQKNLRSSQAAKNTAEATGIGIDNQTRGRKNEADIQNTYADTMYKNALNAQVQALLPYQINNLNNLAILSQAQSGKTIAEAHMTNKQLEYFDQNMRADLNIKSAQYYSLMKAGLLSEKQAQLAVATAAKVIAEKTGIDAHNKYVDGIAFWTWYGTKMSAIEQNWRAADARNQFGLSSKELGWFDFNQIKEGVKDAMHVAKDANDIVNSHKPETEIEQYREGKRTYTKKRTRIR